METSKEALLQIFTQIDKDGSGFIDQEEILQLAKELGQELTSHEIKKVMQYMDTDGDGQISFDEFYIWWFYGKQNKLESLIYNKYKGSKALNKLQKKVQKKLGQFLEQKYEQGTTEHFIQLNVGEFEHSKTCLSVDLRGGQVNQNFSSKIQDLFTQTDAGAAVYFWFKCNNPELVKNALENFFVEIFDLLMTFVPEDKQEIGIAVKDSIKYEIAYDQNHVYVRLVILHDIAAMYLSLGQGYVKTFMPQTQDIDFKVKIETKVGPEDYLANPATPVLDQINKGIKLTGDFKINKQYLETLRDYVITTLDKLIAEQKKNKTFRRLVELLPFCFIESSKIRLNFDHFETICQDLQIPNNLHLTLNHGLDQTKKVPVNDVLGSIPFIADLFQVLKENAFFDFHTSVFYGDLSVTLHVRADGLGKLFEKILQ